MRLRPISTRFATESLPSGSRYFPEWAELSASLIRMNGMGRIPRVHYPGAVYHVTAKGVDDRDIFECDADRVDFLRDLGRIESAAAAKVIAYCLMGNHFHLVIKVSIVPLALIMQRFAGGYSRTFNCRHGRTGHLFQARYSAKLIQSDAYFANVIPYVHMNPVRAGFVSRPEDWPWSSYKVGMPTVIAADFDPWPDAEESGRPLIREMESKRKSIEVLAAVVAYETGLDEDSLRSRSRCRAVVAAKRLLVEKAFREGYCFRQIADWLGAPFSSVCRYGRANTATMRSLTLK